MDPLFRQLDILRLSGGDQRQHVGPITAAAILLARLHLLGNHLPELFPDLRHHRTIPGRRFTVGSDDAKLQRDIGHDTVNRKLVKGLHLHCGSLFGFPLPLVNLICSTLGFLEKLIHVNAEDILGRRALDPIPVTPEMQLEDALAGLLLRLDDRLACVAVDIASHDKTLS